MAIIDAAELLVKELEEQYDAADDDERFSFAEALDHAVSCGAVSSASGRAAMDAWRVRRRVVHEFMIPSPEQCEQVVGALLLCHFELTLGGSRASPAIYTSYRDSVEHAVTSVDPELERQRAEAAHALKVAQSALASERAKLEAAQVELGRMDATQLEAWRDAARMALGAAGFAVTVALLIAGYAQCGQNRARWKDDAAITERSGTATLAGR